MSQIPRPNVGCSPDDRAPETRVAGTPCARTRRYPTRLNGAQRQEPHAPVSSRAMLRPARAALPPGRVNADERKKQGMNANGPEASMTRRGFRVQTNPASHVAAERRGRFAFITGFLRSSAFPPCLPPCTAHPVWRISTLPGQDPVHRERRPARSQPPDNATLARLALAAPPSSSAAVAITRAGLHASDRGQVPQRYPHASRRSVICSARSQRPHRSGFERQDPMHLYKVAHRHRRPCPAPGAVGSGHVPRCCIMNQDPMHLYSDAASSHVERNETGVRQVVVLIRRGVEQHCKNPCTCAARGTRIASVKQHPMSSGFAGPRTPSCRPVAGTPCTCAARGTRIPSAGQQATPHAQRSRSAGRASMHQSRRAPPSLMRGGTRRL